MKRIFPCFMIVILFALPTKGAENNSSLPVPRGFELQVQFWVNVYTKYSISQRIIHDGDKPERIYKVGKHPQKKLFLRAAHSVRIQGGMKEAFREGIVRSGRYLSAIQKILRANGIPEELAYLPHVESSFNPQARSRSGAVGIWQFTRGTGKCYLSINRRIDERKDPLLSTAAASRLLKDYYEILGTWPSGLWQRSALMSRSGFL